MSTAGRELLTIYSKRARVGVAVMGGIALTTLASQGCSDRFGTAGCEETRTCKANSQGGTQAERPAMTRAVLSSRKVVPAAA